MLHTEYWNENTRQMIYVLANVPHGQDNVNLERSMYKDITNDFSGYSREVVGACKSRVRRSKRTEPSQVTMGVHIGLEQMTDKA